MNEKQQKECHLLIKRYKELKQEATKVKYRNKIYLLLKDFIIIQMKSVLSKWKKHVSGEELLSNSWDVFVFCLDYYDPIKFSSPVPHFYRYIKYWLLMWHAKKDESICLPIEELADTLTIIDSPENIAFGKLLKLYNMREAIPDNNKVVWDDAFLSLSYTKKKSDNYRSEKIGMDYNTYRRLKLSFKGIIRYVLES